MAIIDTEKNEMNILSTFVDHIRLRLIELQEAKGMKASGASAAALRVDNDADTKTSTLVDGLGYFRFQEFGRGPTSSSPESGPITLQQAIYAWLAYRKYGFDYVDDKKRLSLSYAIAKSIHKKGNLIGRKPTGILSQIINETLITQLTDELTRNFLVQISSDVIPQFKTQ